MAFKSILEIDIQDDKFRRFQELFRKYQEQLAKTPGNWAKANKEMGAASATAEELAGYLASQREQTEGLGRAARTAEGSFERTKKHVTAISAGLAEATRHIIRLGGLGGLAGGLLGVGGLWGLDRLAGGVASRRRESIGLGASYGGLSSFGINFGRAIDPSAILAGISGAMADPRRISPYRALGMSAGEMSGDSTDVAARYLSRLRGFAQRTSPELLGTLADAYGLGETGVSVEDLRRLRSMSNEEFSQLQSGFGKGKGTLGLPAESQKAWQDFITQMQTAGRQIENTFVRGLTPLAEPITRLSGSFADAASAMLGSEGFTNLMKEAGDALNRFAGYVAKPEFQKDVESFIQDVGKLASAVSSAVHWLAGMVGGSSGHWAAADKNISISPGAMNLLTAIEKTESGGNPNAVSPKGARGLYQLMPGTFKQYGTGDINDPVANQNAAERYLAHLLQKYGNDTNKALAAYNWGEGNLDTDISRNGAGWMNHLPTETSNYLNKVNSLYSRFGGGVVEININNATGGNAVVTTNQASK